MLTEQDLNWDGREIVKWGKHAGERWMDLHANTLEWYVENLESGPLKSCSEAELDRRDELTDGNYLLYTHHEHEK